MTGTKVIRTSAPVRIDFAGAWTDVAPFSINARGAVVNAAIDLRTHVDLVLEHDRYELHAADLEERVEAASIAGLQQDGHLDLLKAAVRTSGIPRCRLRTSAEAPPGSGLGTSGALSVALTHAMHVASDRRITPIALAEEAWRLETVDAAVPGGKQDQYAAALGGFHHIAFDHGDVAARALNVDTAFVESLAAHTLICYTGRSRFSGGVITRVMDAYAAGDAEVGDALHRLADIADRMAEAFESADLSAIARLLSANWQQQQRLDPGMCTPEMTRLGRAMVGAGAAGGKAAGAGAGGSMFFVVPGDPGAAREAARECGATVLTFDWAPAGARIDEPNVTNIPPC
jgi:D-glycero-alpha-D-manno-heptose-7-phosphate kinase